ncbi:MAG: DUF1064 domain-containing protein [Muribaculaceae bacterium]|nr:DUF1064 domain-containing protein [Muribaculaceae bacterium]
MKPIRIRASSLPALRKKPATKYGNRPTGGHASRKEHKRAILLRLWERTGKISDLREQVSFELIPAQYDEVELSIVASGTNPPKPKRILIEHPCRYIADFVYVDADGNTIVEDTKGIRTKEYIIKRKLMLWVHGIRIHEV